MRNSIFSILFLFLSAVSMADTPPPGTVKLRGGTDNTTIGNVADSIKVNLTNSITAVISGNTPVTQATSPWVISGDTGRTWDLLNSTDSVTSFQGGAWTVGVNNFPTVIGVTQSTTPWIVDGSGVVQPVSGTVTANAGTGTFQTNVTNSTLAVTQSGLWSTGRTWTLSSGSDSISASVSNFPVLQQVDLEKIVGASPSVTNYLPTRISNGTSYVDPTQIRLLTSSDVVTADQGGAWTVTANAGTGTFQTNVTNASIPVTQSGTWTVQQGAPPWAVSATQSGSWTTGRTWTLSNGTDSVNIGNFPATTAVTQSTSPWVVSGTVTANIGTTNGLALDATVSAPQGSVSGGTAGTKSELAGGVYNSTPPTLTNGQQAAFQLDSSGNLKTTATLTASSVTANQGTPNTLANGWPVEVTDGTNLLGTSTHPIRIDPTGTTTQPVSGTVTANQGGSWTVAATQSGTWTTGRTWNLSSGSDSVTAVVSGTVGVTQSTSPWVVSGTVTANAGTGTFTVGQSSGANLHVDIDNFPATTAVTQSTSPWVISGTVTANAGTNLNTSLLALDTSVNGILVSQGSTTSGEKGPLIQGAVTTASPSYTTAQTSPLSLTTAGALRVDASATTQPISGTITANQGGAWTVSATQSGTWTTGRTWNLSSGSDSVAVGGTVGVTQSTSPWVVSGTVTANAGTGTFTVGQSTGSNLHVDVDNFPATTAVTQSTSPWVVSGTVTSNQGTAAALSGAWPVEVTDGTNVLGTSTHPIRIDPTGTTTQPVSGTVSVSGTVGVTQSTSPWVVSGTVTANAGTGTFQTNVTNASIPVTQSGSWTVTANAGTNLNTSALALDTSVNGILVAQGATTSGESGPLIQGAVTTSSPSYTTAKTNPLSLTTAGALRVDASATTQPISGTVTANQGGSWTVAATESGTWTVQPGNTANTTAWLVTGTGGTFPATQSGTWNINNISGTISLPTGAATSDLQTTGNTSLATIATNTTPLAQGSSTPGQTGNLIMGQSTTGAPSEVNAQTYPLNLNLSGALRVDASGYQTPVVGTGTNGSPNGGVLSIQGVSGGTAVPVSGTVTANQGGTWTVQPGNTANTTAWLVTGTGGTFPATQSGTWNITNISGTISLPTGASTSALQTTGNTSLSTIATNTTPLTLTQGSTTSGELGNLIMGAVTTAAPSYTTAQTSPLSLNTSGGLRVDGSGVTQPVSGTVTANAGTNLNTSLLALQSGSNTMLDRSGSGTITALNGTISALVNGASTIVWNVTGTWVATVIVEGTTDGTNWFSVLFSTSGTNESVFIQITSPNTLVVNCGGFQSVRLRASAFTSGTIAAAYNIGAGINTAQVTSYNAFSFNAQVVGNVAAGSAISGNPVQVGGSDGTDVRELPINAKNTQSTYAVSTQNQHDTGRNLNELFMAVPVVTTATETLMSLTGYTSGAAVAATTTPAVVPTGKTYRLTSVDMTYVAITTAGYTEFRLRANTGGVVAVTSPLVISWICGGPSTTAGVSQHCDVPIPEGMEFAAGTGIGITQQGYGATGTAAAVGYGMISLHGYNY
jgi:hypothetical protein